MVQLLYEIIWESIHLLIYRDKCKFHKQQVIKMDM